MSYRNPLQSMCESHQRLWRIWQTKQFYCAEVSGIGPWGNEVLWRWLQLGRLVFWAVPLTISVFCSNFIEVIFLITHAAPSRRIIANERDVEVSVYEPNMLHSYLIAQWYCIMQSKACLCFQHKFFLVITAVNFRFSLSLYVKSVLSVHFSDPCSSKGIFLLVWSHTPTLWPVVSFWQNALIEQIMHSSKDWKTAGFWVDCILSRKYT